MTFSPTSSAASERIRPTIWIALLAVAVYLLLAAVLGNILGDLAPDDEIRGFVLSHFIPLPIGIVLGLLFVRWAGWKGIWRETPTPALRPRRLWLIVIPVLVIALALVNLISVDWAATPVTTILLIVIGTLMVGLGEELYLRGILLTAVRARHGELVTLLVTSFVFAVAHIVGSLWAGLPSGFIVFQVGALTLTGASLYWIRRVTGRLWVGVLVHALTDAALYLASGPSRPTSTVDTGALSADDTLLAVFQTLLTIAVLVGVVSVAREDHRRRKARRVIVPPTGE